MLTSNDRTRPKPGPDSPAKFSAVILDELSVILDRWRAQLPRPLNPINIGVTDVDDTPISVLDPFAGVGGIHQLADPDTVTVGVELEAEWADRHDWTLQGDATALPFADDSFSAAVTSPAYGNRMADAYLGEPCPGCEGDGTLCRASVASCAPLTVVECGDCEGSGRKPSRRYSYAISLGRKLSDGSGAALHWGQGYRDLHGLCVEEMTRVVAPGGLIVVNLSDHIRGGERQWVTDWWLRTLLERGCRWLEGHTVSTRRVGHGANRNARVDGEQILVVQR